MKNKKYRVIRKTDLYHARRYVGFNKNTGIQVCESGLTLNEARKALLGFLNNKLENDGYCTVKRWGTTPDKKLEVYSFSDGTRCFSYDVFSYIIEEETDND